MPTYLHRLYQMREEGCVYASCTDLAKYMNIDQIVARKDIAMTGLAGHRRYGYRIDDLIDAILRFVGWDKPLNATLIGAGALGSALLGYPDFIAYNLRIDSVFDIDPLKIGHEIHGHEVYDIQTLAARLKNNPPKIGILCVSNAAAQEAADQLIALDVRYLWNFANVCLNVPENVIVQREVIAGGFAVLAAKIKAVESGERLAED
ncbi:MAG: redox-sensing transcriptional repressor Rex [Victivallales bacterium]|nr:redox-sensing transcriptional repressor Rex [Victivallales bacterium]